MKSEHQDEVDYMWKCDKSYASSQSLWNHKQRCKINNPSALKKLDKPDVLELSAANNSFEEACLPFPDITNPAKNHNFPLQNYHFPKGNPGNPGLKNNQLIHILPTAFF